MLLMHKRACTQFNKSLTKYIATPRKTRKQSDRRCYTSMKVCRQFQQFWLWRPSAHGARDASYCTENRGSITSKAVTINVVPFRLFQACDCSYSNLNLLKWVWVILFTAEMVGKSEVTAGNVTLIGLALQPRFAVVLLELMLSPLLLPLPFPYRPCVSFATWFFF